MAILGTALKMGAGMLKGKAKKRVGKKVAQNVVGRKEPTSSPLPGRSNPSISFGHDSPAMSSAINISESTGRSTRTATTAEGLAVQIETKTVHLKDALRRSLILDKEKERNRKTIVKKGKRTAAEEKLEKDSSKGRFGFAIPGAKKVKSLWERIKNFFITILWGKIALSLMGNKGLFSKLSEWLPKIVGFVDGVIDWGGKFLNFMASAIKIGYDVYDWARLKVGQIFGEDALKAFDGMMGNLNIVINGVIAIGMAMAAMMSQLAITNFLGAKAAAATKATAAGSAVTTGVTAGGTTVTTSGGVAAGAGKVAGIGAAGTAGIVASAGLLASGLGEGIGQLNKWGYGVEKDWKQKADSKAWWDPRKWWWGIGAGLIGMTNRAWSFLGGIFDIVGAPFRMIIELIRWPFLSKDDRQKQRLNMVKWDTRIREQFRKALNAVDILGVVDDDEGSWGNIYGDERGAQEMGYTQPGAAVPPVSQQSKKEPGHLEKSVRTDPVTRVTEGSEAAQRLLKDFPQIKTRDNDSQIFASGLGFYMKKSGAGRPGKGDYGDPPQAGGDMEHPDHGGVVASHRGRGHYLGKALDLGGNSATSSGYQDDQKNLWPYISDFMTKYGVDKEPYVPQVIHGVGESFSPRKSNVMGPDRGHNDHFHIEFHKGGEVPGTGERMAKLLGGEVVIDVDSAEHKPVKNMLLAINKASTYEGVVDAIRKFAPYEAMSPETITVPNPTQQASSQSAGTKGIMTIPIFGDALQLQDNYQILYKGS